jgi:hypothetical protein
LQQGRKAIKYNIAGERILPSLWCQLRRDIRSCFPDVNLSFGATLAVELKMNLEQTDFTIAFLNSTLEENEVV